LSLHDALPISCFAASKRRKLATPKAAFCRVAHMPSLVPRWREHLSVRYGRACKGRKTEKAKGKRLGRGFPGNRIRGLQNFCNDSGPGIRPHLHHDRPQEGFDGVWTYTHTTGN